MCLERLLGYIIMSVSLLVEPPTPLHSTPSDQNLSTYLTPFAELSPKPASHRRYYYCFQLPMTVTLYGCISIGKRAQRLNKTLSLTINYSSLRIFK